MRSIPARLSASNLPIRSVTWSISARVISLSNKVTSFSTKRAVGTRPRSITISSSFSLLLFFSKSHTIHYILCSWPDQNLYLSIQSICHHLSETISHYSGKHLSYPRQIQTSILSSPQPLLDLLKIRRGSRTLLLFYCRRIRPAVSEHLDLILQVLLYS